MTKSLRTWAVGALLLGAVVVVMLPVKAATSAPSAVSVGEEASRAVEVSQPCGSALSAVAGSTGPVVAGVDAADAAAACRSAGRARLLFAGIVAVGGLYLLARRRTRRARSQ